VGSELKNIDTEKEKKKVETKQFQTFNNLSLAIPSNKSTSLEECLHEYMNTETVKLNDEDYKKRLFLAAGFRLPEAFCFHIRRLYRQDSRITKDDNEVTFPLFFSLETNSTHSEFKFKFETPNAQNSTIPRAISNNITTAATTTNKVTMNFKTQNMQKLQATPLSGGSNRKPVPIPNNLKPISSAIRAITSDVTIERTNIINSATSFYLRAVIEHHGDQCGHYVVYKRRSEDDRWWYISDEKVMLSDKEQIDPSKVYMLFYEKKTL